MRSRDLSSPRFRLGEFLIERLIGVTAFVSFAAIILIVVFAVREALPVFTGLPEVASSDPVWQEPMESYGEEALGEQARELAAETAQREDGRREAPDAEATLSNLLGSVWQPVSSEPRYGLWPLFAGSLKVSLISILIGAPLAILASLFTTAFASPRLKEVLKPTIELLAGIPSVVIGFFALIAMASTLQSFLGTTFRLNALVGGLALALAVIPIVYTIAEDALASVPHSLTEASLALGATRWQTALFIILPAATPGIFAAVLLGIGRAFGETMIVLMATGNAALATWNPADPVRTMSATIGAEMAEVVFGDIHYSVLFLIGGILFLVTFVLNAVAEFYVRRRLMARFGGKG
jgi:phosphate transport system permease protein